jgi:hypothetical protein
MAGEIYAMPGNHRTDIFIALGGTLVLALVLFHLSSYAPVPPAPLTAGAASVEILALDDPSLRPALAEVEALLAAYDGRLRVVRYDPTTAAGESFARAKGISREAGLVIFVNGTQTFSVDGQTVTFESPAGSPAPWSVAQLAAVLRQVAGK